MLDPIRLGSTRPATIAGVTYFAFIAIGLLGGVAVSIGMMFSPWGFLAGLIAAPIYGLFRAIETGEPRGARLLWMAILTRAPTIRNRGLWGGRSSASPFGRQ